MHSGMRISKGYLAVAVAALCLSGMRPEALAATDEKGLTYRTTIELSDARPGAPVRITSRIVAAGDTYEKLDSVESDLAPGMGVNEKAFAVVCVLSDTGSESGSVCPEKYAGAKIGSARMTTSMFGEHTVNAYAYMVDPKSTPDGENMILYFPSGQVFGLGQQTILGRLTLGHATERKLVMKGIGDQLSLPFGMQARVIRNEFVFEGQGDELPYTNPASGSPETWEFRTKLGWDGGGQESSFHPTVSGSAR